MINAEGERGRESLGLKDRLMIGAAAVGVFVLANFISRAGAQDNENPAPITINDFQRAYPDKVLFLAPQDGLALNAEGTYPDWCLVMNHFRPDEKCDPMVYQMGETRIGNATHRGLVTAEESGDHVIYKAQLEMIGSGEVAKAEYDCHFFKGINCDPQPEQQATPAQFALTGSGTGDPTWVITTDIGLDGGTPWDAHMTFSVPPTAIWNQDCFVTPTGNIANWQTDITTDPTVDQVGFYINVWELGNPASAYAQPGDTVTVVCDNLSFPGQSVSVTLTVPATIP